MTTKEKMISTRISADLETLVIQYADKHKWSKSFAIGEILKEYFYELTKIGDQSQLFLEITKGIEIQPPK